MKRLLRRIFYWDAPAQGAFFGLTLLFMLPRWFYALGMDVVLPFMLREWMAAEMALYLLGGLMGGVLLYALIVLPRFLKRINIASRKGYVWALCGCAVLMIGFWMMTDINGDHELYWRYWWVIPTLFVVGSAVYASRPEVKIWEWIVAAVSLAACMALYCVLNLADIQKLSSPVFTLEPVGIMGIGELSEWLLTICCILLFAAAYLLFGRIIAKGGGVPFRSLFGRGVVALWIVFAVMYIASVGLAVYGMHDAKVAWRELDAYWGMPVKTSTLVELYGKNDNIDQAFWDEFNGLLVNFPELFKKYDGLNDIEVYPDAVFPQEIHAEWKAAFNESAELRRKEEMLDSPPPLPERKFDFNFDRLRQKNLTECRIMVRWELWRVRLALEDKDIDAAKKALRRIDSICVPLVADYNEVSGLVWMSIESMRAKALCMILSSGLADETWLREQSNLLLEKERMIPEVHKRMILGQATHMMEMLDMTAEKTSYASFLLLPESWVLLGRETASMARCHCISNFKDFPEKPASIFTAMLSSGLRTIGTRKIPVLVAIFRVARGLIEAELSRLKTGSYPAELENLEEDPFSGKPLKYAVGDHEIHEEHFVLNEEYEKEGEYETTVVDAVQKQLGASDEWAKELLRCKKYTFKKETRTVNAVQIWSVGPDGVSGDATGDDPLKSRDDVRFYIVTSLPGSSSSKTP